MRGTSVISLNITIQEQQHDVLVMAIDKYLEWRNDRSVDDGRGYQSGLFTRFRHLTNFGKARANQLKAVLSSNLLPDNIVPLQTHFRANSKTNNHSLDTYLLESIHKHKQLFLQLFPTFNSSTHSTPLSESQRAPLRQAILNLKINNSAEYAYQIAQLYEKNNHVADHVKKMCDYYAIAVRANHVASLNALKKLADIGNSEAQYILMFDHHHCRGEVIEAINWCMRAAEQNHAKAIYYLFNTIFSAEQYLMIAEKYAKGDSFTKRNDVSAATFYEKAAALKNKTAAMHLGHLYQPSLDLPYITRSQETKKNFKRSFDYYLIAAQQGDVIALNAMVKISEHVDDDALSLTLSKVYLDNFSDYVRALIILKKLADKNVSTAITQGSKLISSNPEYAYVFANLYKSENQLQKACVYYAIAAQHKHVASQQHLETLLNSSEMTAEEITNIGMKYYKASDGITKDDKKAIMCFEKACKKSGSAIAHYQLGVMHQADTSDGVKKNLVAAARYYQLAINRSYLPAKKQLDALLNSSQITSDDLVAIAAMYRDGCDGITRNAELALTLSKKASDRGNQFASLELGHFYQVDHDGVPKNISSAFFYYSQAAKQGNRDALVPLEILGEEIDSKNQKQLSEMHGTLFHNQERSQFWKTKALEVEQFHLKK